MNGAVPSRDTPAVSSQRALVGVVGDGVVGRRVARRLSAASPAIDIRRIDTRLIDLATDSDIGSLDVVVLAHPGPHHSDARRFLQRGVSVVSVCDAVDDMRVLLDLDALAREHGATLVPGAGMATGLATLLARQLSSGLEMVDEVHIAIHGTAGPACARQHHRALAGTAIGVIDGVELTARAGTGRRLVWFPEPVGAYDCYRAELPSPLIVRRAFPDVERIQARMSANRRDRLTSRLPMLTRPHHEGGVGAVRVEVRGVDADGGRDCVVAGVAELVGTATAGTACAFVELLVDGSLTPGLVVPGAADLATERLLRSIERFGVRLQEFTGVPSV